MKVAFFEVKPWETEYLKKEFSNTETLFFAGKLDSENAKQAKDAEVISVFIGSAVTGEALGWFEGLKMIATRSTGFDHISLEDCKKNNVAVSNVPHYGDNSVAEHAFALILDLSRKIHESIARVKSGGFSFEGLTGFDLKDKTIGVVGMGNIGQHVARIANGFEMKVLVFDVNQDKKLAKALGFSYASLDDLLKNSDIITLHVPYNKHTHYLINKNNISLIKKGSYLINTSRGAVIETDALVHALDNKTLAGAGLDVLEEEDFLREEAVLLSKEFSEKYNLKTVLEDHVLMEKDNVIITPHNAFNSKEALERILETTVDNIKGFMGGKPINVVG